MYTVKTQDPGGHCEVTEYYAPSGKNAYGDVTKRVTSMVTQLIIAWMQLEISQKLYIQI